MNINQSAVIKKNALKSRNLQQTLHSHVQEDTRRFYSNNKNPLFEQDECYLDLGIQQVNLQNTFNIEQQKNRIREGMLHQKLISLKSQLGQNQDSPLKHPKYQSVYNQKIQKFKSFFTDKKNQDDEDKRKSVQFELDDNSSSNIEIQQIKSYISKLVSEKKDQSSQNSPIANNSLGQSFKTEIKKNQTIANIVNYDTASLQNSNFEIEKFKSQRRVLSRSDQIQDLSNRLIIKSQFNKKKQNLTLTNIKINQTNKLFKFNSEQLQVLKSKNNDQQSSKNNSKSFQKIKQRNYIFDSKMKQPNKQIKRGLLTPVCSIQQKLMTPKISGIGLKNINKQFGSFILETEQEQQLSQKQTIIIRKFDQDFEKADPLQYMKQNLLECQKYNYTVEKSLKEKNIFIHFEVENDSLNIYEASNDSLMETFQSKNTILGKQMGRHIHSIDMHDVKGFIYGSFSSRFWMHRLFINQIIFKDQEESRSIKSLSPKKKNKRNTNIIIDDVQRLSKSIETKQFQILSKDIKQNAKINNDIPFFSWNCITLILKNRDIDLVIKDELQMKMFLMFLIIKTNSFNGNRNSYSEFQNEALIKHEVDKIYRKFFLIMKIKMKISYEACVKCMTIPELILRSILKLIESSPEKVFSEKSSITKSYLKSSKTKKSQNKSSKSIHSNSNIKSVLNSNLQQKHIFQRYVNVDNTFLKKWDGNQQQIIDYQIEENVVSDMKDIDKKSKQMKFYEKLSELKSNMNLKIVELIRRYNKIQMLIKLNLLKGEQFIQCVLQRIELSKQIFALQLFTGREQKIPRDLNMSTLSRSYQYYDCIFQIVKQNRYNHQQYFGNRKFKENHLLIQKDENIDQMHKKIQNGIYVNIVNNESEKKIFNQNCMGEVQQPQNLFELEFLTDEQVGLKRESLFNSKLMYLNQITSLQQKMKMMNLQEKLDQEVYFLLKDLYDKIFLSQNIDMEDFLKDDSQIKQFLSGQIQIQGVESVMHLLKIIKQKSNDFQKLLNRQQEKKILIQRNLIKKNIDDFDDFQIKNQYVDQLIHEQKIFDKTKEDKQDSIYDQNIQNNISNKKDQDSKSINNVSQFRNKTLINCLKRNRLLKQQQLKKKQ